MHNYLNNYIYIKKGIDNTIKIRYTIQVHREVEQLAARWAHNPKVGGSSPSLATKLKNPISTLNSNL